MKKSSAFDVSGLDPHEQMAWGLAVLLSIFGGMVLICMGAIVAAILGYNPSWVAMWGAIAGVAWIVLHYAPFLFLNPAHYTARLIWRVLPHHWFLVIGDGDR